MDNKTAQIRQHLMKAAAALDTATAAAAAAAPAGQAAPATAPGFMGQTMNSAQAAIQNARDYFLANRRAAAMGAGGMGALAGAGLGYGIGGNWESALAGGALGGAAGGAAGYYGFPYIPGAQMPQQAPMDPQMAAAMKAASANAFLKRALAEGVLPAEQSAQMPAQVDPSMMDQFNTGMQNAWQGAQNMGQQAWQGMQGLGQQGMQGMQQAGDYLAQNPYAAAAAGAGVGGLMGAGIAGLAGGDMGDAGIGGLLGAGAGALGGYYGGQYLGQDQSQPTPEELAAMGLDPAQLQQMVDQEAMKQAAMNDAYLRKLAFESNIGAMYDARQAAAADTAARAQQMEALKQHYMIANGVALPGMIGAGVGAGLGAGIGAMAGEPGYGAAIGASVGGLGGVGFGAYTGIRAKMIADQQAAADQQYQDYMANTPYFKQSRADAYVEGLMKRAVLGDEAAQEALETIAPAAAEVVDDLDEVSDAVAEVAALDPSVVQAAQIAVSTQDINEAHEAASMVADATSAIAAGTLTDGMTSQLVDEAATKAAAGYQYLASLGMTKQAVGWDGVMNGMYKVGAKTPTAALIKSVTRTFRKMFFKPNPKMMGFPNIPRSGTRMAQNAYKGMVGGMQSGGQAAMDYGRQVGPAMMAGGRAAGSHIAGHPKAYAGAALGAAGLGGGGYAGYQYMNQEPPAPMASAENQEKEAAANAYINDLVKIAGAAQAGEAAMNAMRSAGKGVSRGASFVGEHPLAFGAGAVGAGAIGAGGYVYATLPDGTPVMVPAQHVQPIPQQPMM